MDTISDYGLDEAAARFLDHITGGALGPVAADEAAITLARAGVTRRWGAIGRALERERRFRPGALRGWGVEDVALLSDRFAEVAGQMPSTRA